MIGLISANEPPKSVCQKVIIGSQNSAAIGSSKAIEECVEFARRNGVGVLQMDRRAQMRMPFLHPVRYCLGLEPAEDHTQPGYTLNISLDGITIYYQQAFMVGELIWVRLPLPDGKPIWLSGTIIHCEPDAEHYRAGIAFTVQDQQDTAGQ